MKVKVSSLVPNPNNPRVIRDISFLKLKKSIERFPEMIEKREIVCTTQEDGKYLILGGNMRYRAYQDLGIKYVHIKLADDWTEEQKKEFIIADNVNFGEWDYDILANNWNAHSLEMFDLEVFSSYNTDFTPEFTPTIDTRDVTEEEVEIKARELANKYIQEHNSKEVMCPSCGYEFSVD